MESQDSFFKKDFQERVYECLQYGIRQKFFHSSAKCSRKKANQPYLKILKKWEDLSRCIMYHIMQFGLSINYLTFEEVLAFSDARKC